MAIVTITISSNAAQIVRQLQEFPEKMATAVARAMDLENELTVGHIQRKRLTGAGPFPPAQHRLGVVTNVLRRSLRASKAVVQGKTVSSSIGTNVRYAGVHEFGFVGTVSVRAHRRRAPQGDRFRIRDAIVSRVSAIRSGDNPSPRRQVSSRIAQVKPHTRPVKIPARAPIQTGVADRVNRYGKAISGAIVEAWGRIDRGANE